MSDLILGRGVINAFINSSDQSFDEVVLSNATFSKSKAQQDIFIEGLGAQFREVLKENYSKLDNAMENLARVAGSNIPRAADFRKAMLDEAMNTSTLDAITFVGIESFKQLGAGAQAIGNQVIESGKLLNLLLPVIIIGGLYLFGKKAYDRI